MIESAVKKVPNDILFPSVAQLLDEGMEVRLQAKGRSMTPYIRDGRDLLILKKVLPQDLKVHDIVLALCTNEHYVVHRIIDIDGDRITLMGDGNLYGTETCRRNNVLGILTGIERNGKTIDCNTDSERRKAKRLNTCYRAYAKTRHTIKKIITLQIFRHED